MNQDRKKIMSIIQQRQYLEALDRYRDYLKRFPNEVTDIMIDLYRMLIYDYKNLNIRLIICELCMQFHFYKDALAELGDMIDIDASFSQSYFLLGKFYNKTADHAAVEPLFKEAFNRGIRDSIILDTLPKLYLDQNNVHAAKGLFEVLVDEPDMPLHYYKVLAELNKQTGNFDKCISLYEKLVEKDPSFTADACTICEDILSDYPGYSLLRKKLIRFYLKGCKPEMAIYHLELCSESDMTHEEIVKQYQELLSIFPSHKDGIFSFIDYLMGQGLLTDACDKLEMIRGDFERYHDYIKATVLRMKEIDEKHHYVTLFLIDVLIAEKNYADALSTIMDILPSNRDMDFLNELEKRCDSIKQVNSVQKQLLALCLASLYYYKQQYNLALGYCEQASPDSIDLVSIKAKIYIEQKQFSLAKQFLSQQLKKFPTQKVIYDLMYQLSQSMNKLELTQSKQEQLVASLISENQLQTIQIAQSIQAEDSSYSLAQLSLIRSFIALNKFEQALQISEQIGNYFRESHQNYLCQALFFKSLCYYNLHQFKKAYDCLSEIEAVDISFSFSTAMRDFLKIIPFSSNRGYAMTGIINTGVSKFSLSTIQNFDEYLYLNKKQNVASFGLSHNNQGVEFLVKQNFVSAESEFNVALQLDPSLVISFSNLGLLKLMNDDLDQAEFYIKMAESQNAELDVIFLNKGLLLYKRQQFDKALEAFQMAIKLNPHNNHAKFNIGMIHFEMGRLNIAFQYFDKLRFLGLFFMPLQHLFYYLDSNYTDLQYWNKVTQQYGFETYY